MITRTYLLDFFRELEKSIPPPPLSHHAMMLSRFGSDKDGWEEKLAVQVNVDGKFHAFFLDESDFDESAEDLAAEIASIAKGPYLAATQLGVGRGQFTQ